MPGMPRPPRTTTRSARSSSTRSKSSGRRDSDSRRSSSSFPRHHLPTTTTGPRNIRPVVVVVPRRRGLPTLLGGGAASRSVLRANPTTTGGRCRTNAPPEEDCSGIIGASVGSDELRRWTRGDVSCYYDMYLEKCMSVCRVWHGVCRHVSWPAAGGGDFIQALLYLPRIPI